MNGMHRGVSQQARRGPEDGVRKEEGSRGGTGCGTRFLLLSNWLMSQSATTKATEDMLRTAKIIDIA
eukprot:COSAG06_NODE_631_length_13616_cov_6.997411_6_plen_67_part_00